MGDFSSTFAIHNNLAVDLLVTKNGDPDHGYWLRWPNDGKVGLLSTSDQFQLKDNWGAVGTEGKVWITDTANTFKIGLHMMCPFNDAYPNAVEIWVESGDQPDLLIAAGPVTFSGHPFIFDVIIEKKT